MTDAGIIEGELAETSSNADIVKHDESAQQVAVFNPLDAEPVAFAKDLVNRQENYDNLASHLQLVLAPGKDFGKIHVVKDCENKYTCTNTYHFSDDQLFAPGADKILGILGLAMHYPGIEDYKKAALGGVKIEDVITDALVLGHNQQVIAEGVGAASRAEFKGDLNRTMKRAQKRGRVEAVKRLPAISALFQDEEWLAGVYREAASNRGNSVGSRNQTVKNRWDTGTRLEVCPIGNDIKGKQWRDIDTGALEWLVANVVDKPDITRAATEELNRRPNRPEGSSSTCAPSSPASEEPMQ